MRLHPVSGESFVRQLMMGKAFFRDEFGVENRVLFLPDVFGYSAALLQILKKSGVDYFVTSKISWNDTDTMPVDAFMWQGIDGTELFTTLFDKAAEREVFAAHGNCFTAYEDLPYAHDNREISDYYRAKPYPLDAEAVITPVYDGSRAGFRVEKQYMDCTITQHIWLGSDSRRVDFDNRIQWNSHHQVQKVSFPLDVHANEATYEIQYGHIRRPTHQNTSWDAARFEVCAHKWADISENGYGVALLNDCKYGHSAHGSTLELTVLKAFLRLRRQSSCT